MKGSNGFTLVELMISVAIIGILATIAIPRYQEYIARTNLTRAASEVLRLKANVESFLAAGVHDFNESDLGWVGSGMLELTDGLTFIAGDGLHIRSFSTTKDGYGYFLVTLGAGASSAVDGVNIYIEREQEGVWSCQVEKSSAGFWNESFIPAGCSLLADGAIPVDD